MNELRHDDLPWEDPIVTEVRSAREALLAASGYDLEELCRRLRKKQEEAGRTVVVLPPRLQKGEEEAVAK